MEMNEEFVSQVKEQVKQLGDNTKGLYDSVRKDFEGLKEELSKKGQTDAVRVEAIDKLATALSVKQEELDKKNAEIVAANTARMDAIEVALKRAPAANGVETKLIEEAISFKMACLINQSKKSNGLSQAEFEAVKANPNLDEFKAYDKVFRKYLISHGGQKELSFLPEESKTLSVGVDADGGYTVTPQMSNVIISKIFESDPVRQLASVSNISTDSMEWLVDVDQMGAGWETETVQGGVTTTAKFDKKNIPVHNSYARIHATQKLLEDSSINIESWIGNKAAERFGRLEGASFVTGTGIGQPRGFLTYANGTAWGQVERVNMGAAASLTADGFIDVKYHLSEYYLERANAWLMARSTVAAAMKLKDGNGDYLWKPAMIASDPSSFILGVPVRMSTTMPTVAANALSVVIADWKEAYMIVDRIGISIQRDPYTAKPFVEFYARKRVGGAVMNFEAIKIGVIAV
jgi:HK97 family phage major capsid protein